MSGIETAAKPSLELMFQGARAALAIGQQEALATWVTLKMMVADLHRPAESAFVAAQREEFRLTQTIPSFMRIWVFPYAGTAWRSSMRQDAYLLSTSPVPPPGYPGGKNTRALTLGFGNLLIFALFTQIPDFENYVELDFQGPVVRLWPRQFELAEWPPGRGLNEQQASFIASTLDRLSQSPKMQVVP